MTDDIVERLRSRSPYLDGSSAERIMDEAADYIERLTEHIDALLLVATAHDPEIVRRDKPTEDSQPTDTELADVADKLMLRGWINLLEHAGLSFRERQVIGWALRMAPHFRSHFRSQLEPMI